MTWKDTFDKGVACFKRGHLDQALAHMNQAAELESNSFIIYDSRAAVQEKLGNLKAALLDSKRVIDLAPDRWQGYARSARLFDTLGRHSSVVKMVDHALNRLRSEDMQRRIQLVELREKAVETMRRSHMIKSSYLLGKLPVETLVEIFNVLVDEDHTWAVRLSHVCGHWRRILISTPSAWQTLILSRKHPLQKVKIWKQRAKNRISRMSVAISPLDRASVFTQLQDLSWDHLCSLCISGSAFAELHRMLSDHSLPYTFSKLDELSLLNFMSVEHLSSCLSGPDWKLKVLRLNGDAILMDEWWQRIQQLRELHLTGPLANLSMQFFSSNPSLETLVLNCPRILGTIDDPIDPAVLMKHLKHVQCRDIPDPLCILRSIVAPSLTHFGMSTIAVKANETVLHMASCLSLVELRVANCSLDPCTLPTVLSHTPHLETIQINALDGVVNEMFQHLTPKTADGLPCRALKDIDVSRCADLTTSSVYAFVKARVQHASESDDSATQSAAIVSLKVDGCPNIEPDMLPWFRSKVARFSCVYVTKKDFKKNRRW